MRSTLKTIGSCSKGNTVIETKMLKSRSRFDDKNALKLTYGHMQINKFSPGDKPPFQRAPRLKRPGARPCLVGEGG